MSAPPDALARGRAAFERSAWTDAYEALRAADAERPLEPADLERMAAAAYLVGRDEESIALWERSHHELLAQVEPERAVRCAFWLAFFLLQSGQSERGSGWIARGRRLLDDGERDCVERGYLLFPVAMASIFAADYATAHATFKGAADIAERFDDVDLAILARHGQGRALIRMGETAAGMALLDEVMVAVTTGDASDHRRRRLLQRHPGVRGELRPAARPGVDDRADALVRDATRPRPLSRPVPAAPRRAHAAARRLAGRARGGAPRPRAPVAPAVAALDRRVLLPPGRPAPAAR
jgi:hypothetical protein